MVVIKWSGSMYCFPTVAIVFYRTVVCKSWFKHFTFCEVNVVAFMQFSTMRCLATRECRIKCFLLQFVYCLINTPCNSMT